MDPMRPLSLKFAVAVPHKVALAMPYDDILFIPTFRSMGLHLAHRGHLPLRSRNHRWSRCIQGPSDT